MQALLKEPPKCTSSVNNEMLITNRAGIGLGGAVILSPILSTFFL